MKTSQAVRNIRKYKRRVEVAPKGRMVTDDYGNKLSVKKKADGTFGRRHTLSQGRKRAIRLGGGNVAEKLEQHKKIIKYGSNKDTPTRRHADSAFRRANARDIAYTVAKKSTTYGSKQQTKATYHDYMRLRDYKKATSSAKAIHKGKRKPKDFTK